jgi:hypothetical protein
LAERRHRAGEEEVVRHARHPIRRRPAGAAPGVIVRNRNRSYTRRLSRSPAVSVRYERHDVVRAQNLVTVIV